MQTELEELYGRITEEATNAAEADRRVQIELQQEITDREIATSNLNNQIVEAVKSINEVNARIEELLNSNNECRDAVGKFLEHIQSPEYQSIRNYGDQEVPAYQTPEYDKAVAVFSKVIEVCSRSNSKNKLPDELLKQCEDVKNKLQACRDYSRDNLDNLLWLLRLRLVVAVDGAASLEKGLPDLLLALISHAHRQSKLDLKNFLMSDPVTGVFRTLGYRIILPRKGDLFDERTMTSTASGMPSDSKMVGRVADCLEPGLEVLVPHNSVKGHKAIVVRFVC